MAVGNQATTILWRATVIMLLGWIVGRAIGAIAQSTVDDHIDQYKQQNPIPGQDSPQPSDPEAPTVGGGA